MSPYEYARLMEMQTKSVLFGRPHGNVPEVAETTPVLNDKIFGLDLCCQKSDKKCRKKQKAQLKRKYKNSRYGVSMFQRAVCQMKFEINRDENRIPENIMQVRCSCDFPINFKPRKHHCEPVLQYMTVYRRTEYGNGTQIFEPTTEEVSVACILVKQPKPIQKRTRKNIVSEDK